MKSQSTKLAIRNLLKYKSFSFISLAWLAASLAASIIILTYFFSQLSFDKHIPNSQRTYRIITRLGEGNFWSRTFACTGDALANNSRVESLTAFIYTTNSIVNIGQNEFTVSESVVADTAFMDFFGLKLISGRAEDLGQPNLVFLTPGMAEIFFPGKDPLGKEIYLKQLEGNMGDSLGYYTIAGILEPLPDQTHFGFQMVFSQQGHLSELMNHLKSRKGFGANVYVRLHRDVPASELERELTDVVVPFLQGKPGPPLEAFNSALQPVREIHFTTDINREPRPVIRKSMIYILLSVGLLILVLMTLNFISAVIVQSQLQKKTSHIMRILGANKMELFSLSLVKITLIVGLGLLISWIIIACAEPLLKEIFGSDWSFRSLNSKIIVLGLCAGIPLVVIAALGMHLSLPGRRIFRVFGSLTVIQFAIVIILLCFSMMIRRQISYMDHKDLGYSEQNVCIVRIPSEIPRGSFLVEEIKKQAGVIHASTAHHHPGDVYQSMEFAAGEKTYQFGFRMVDSDALETLEIDLLTRFGSPEGPLEGWVINESFYNSLLQDFSPEDIMAGNFSSEGDDQNDPNYRFMISGVMADFHFSSLHNSIGNFAFAIRDPETNYNRWLMVRYQEGQAEPVLKAIQQMMDQHFQGKGYDLFLLEDVIEEQYEASHNLSAVIRGFTLLSILIAVSGLYGLSLFITRRRTKEIGIRKIFGARSGQIITMLNLEFLRWAGIAFIIASPVSIWALRKWLMNFAYKTSLPWWIFVLSGITIALIAMIAVTWQTSVAARSNPVDTIRSE